MKTAAPDFKIFWDEAYIVHHLTEEIIENPPLLNEAKECGNGDRVFIGSNKGGVSREHPLELTAMDRAYIAGYDIVHTSIFSYIEDELPLLRQASSLYPWIFGQGRRGIFETMCAIC